jgi:uncharacterized membrane protein YoaK (UPF0700 family)
MLRHFGTKRTYLHNLRLATLLSLVAGFVNAVGFLGFLALTTNVTGHAALFAERVASQDWVHAGTIGAWMLLFLFGAWFSSLIITRIGHHDRFSFAVPILLEMAILVFCALYGGNKPPMFSNDFFVGFLLFAMGMQNALVSVISGSVVRTTHLTGTFTDLGIELAQLKRNDTGSQKELKSKIKLRLSIILFFMLGALSGAYSFKLLKFTAFFIPSLTLCLTLVFDVFRLRVKRYYFHLVHELKQRS